MKIIAHRGALSHYCENTLAGILEAVKLPFDGVEFDVRATKDKQVVLMHDATVDRTTNGNGRVSALSLSELAALRTKDGQTVPALETVMGRLQKTNKIINIEIKSHGCAQAVAKHAAKPNVYVSSPLRSELELVKQLEPKAKIGFVTSNPLRLILTARDPFFDFITAHKLLINPRIIRYLYRKKKPAWVYPIDTKEDIANMQNLAVSAVFSDIDPPR